MIKSIEFKNFRKIEDEVMTLSQGLTVIKGKNEASKTTRFEAILYAMYGAKALRTTLADTVTYGKPESSLKVVLSFEFDKVLYTITRSKAGAELRYGVNVVTGQTEVRIFMEHLLGATVDVASNLLFADQNAVRGVLSGGAAAAGSLVEKLANLDVIEGLIERIQAQLPTGNTNVLTGQLGAFEAVLAKQFTPPDESGCKLALTDLDAKKSDLDAHLATRSTMDKLKESAQLTLAKIESAKKHNAGVEAKRRTWQTIADKPITEPRVSMAQIVENEVAMLDAEKAQKRWRAYNTTFPAIDDKWDDHKDRFYNKLVSLPAEIAKLKDQVHAIELTIRSKEALLINEKECAFCKKDLSEVPEVLARNTTINAELSNLNAALDQLKQFYEDTRQEYIRLQKLDTITNEIKIKASQTGYEVDESIPPVPKWPGEIPVQPSAVMDMSQYRKQWSEYTEAVNKRANAAIILSTLEFEEILDDAGPKADLETVDEHNRVYQEKLGLVNKSKEAYNDALSWYAAAKGIYDTEIANQAKAKEGLAQLRYAIAQMERHNALIKKLRTARGPITSKLWNTVIAAIAHYFVQIRGVPSVVTRDADGFKVDGRSVAGLSGSTLDSLGLAVRIALSKLFLPNARFMFLDEVAAGCDSQREIAMLGAVAAAGFEQVLLVTHSDLGDSLADNLVKLS